MGLSFRPFVFEGDDFLRLLDLVRRDYAARGDAFIWHAARLVDWKYNLHGALKRYPDLFGRNAELCLDGAGELRGFWLSEDFNEEFQLFALPGAEELYSPLLERAVADRRGKGAPRIRACAGQAGLEALLTAAGFEPAGGREMVRIFDPRRHLRPPRPADGLRFLSMDAFGDYEAQRLLRRSAWPCPGTPAEDDRLAGEYLRRSPIYDPRFDFVLADAGGAALAGCEAFIDRELGAAEIERVCVRAERRGAGLARRVLEDCLDALGRAGIGRASLTGGSDATIHLYGSLGHRAEVEHLFYELRP